VLTAGFADRARQHPTAGAPFDHAFKSDRHRARREPDRVIAFIRTQATGTPRPGKLSAQDDDKENARC